MPIDYSRFDNIDVSDDEDEQAYKAKEGGRGGRPPRVQGPGQGVRRGLVAGLPEAEPVHRRVRGAAHARWDDVALQ